LFFYRYSMAVIDSMFGNRGRRRVVDVDGAEQCGGTAGAVVGVVALVVGADHEFADLAEGLERLTVAGIQGQGILVEVAGGAGQRGVAGGIRGTAGEGVVELGVALRTAHGNPAEAAIVETMGQFADEIGGSAVEMVP